MRAEDLSQVEASHLDGSVMLEDFRPLGVPFLETEAVASQSPPNFEVLGVRVDAVQTKGAIEKMKSLIEARQRVSHYVAVTGMHGVAESTDDSYVRTALNAADLVVPDGMPLIWLARLHGHALRHRVCGSELMADFCRATGATYSHFFYGGDLGVAEKLAHMLRQQYGIRIAGTYTPPFRPLTEFEEQELESLVESRSPDVFWVGLSTPKQETWMYEHRGRLKTPLMLGVGAAFDINSGRVRRAPKFMQDHGLEWLFRLYGEPRRLWRRYLLKIPAAAWLICLDLIKSWRSRPRPSEDMQYAEANSTGEPS